MADFTKNKRIYSKQMKVMIGVVAAISIVFALIIGLLVESKPSKKTNKEAVDLVGVINESFTEKNTESALSAQQIELEGLKEQLAHMSKKFDSINDAKSKENNLLADKVKALSEQITYLKEEKKEAKAPTQELKNPTIIEEIFFS